MQKTRLFTLFALLILVLTVCRQALETEAPPQANLLPADAAGDWQGTLKVLNTEFELLVHFVEEKGELKGRVDIPKQGVSGLELSEVRLEGNRMRFEMRGEMPTAVFEGEVQGEAMTGTYRQSAFKGQFSLERVDLPATVPTALTPQADLPYLEENIRFQNGAIDLAGTLTLPETGGPFPAVVLISGSGLQDRDNAHYSLPNYRPFRWIADRLAREGIAVLRYDDRGTGESVGGKNGTDTTFDYAEDAESALEYLIARSEIDPQKVGLLGHSEGGMIAAIVAARNPKAAFVVSMAGAGVPGFDLMLRQGELFARAEGRTEAEVREQVEASRKEMELIAAQDWPALEQFLYEETLKFYRSLPDDQRVPDAELEQTAREQAARNMEGMQGWFYTFVTEDPAKYWEEVRVPVLALFGEADMQVDPEQNSPAMQAALAAGGNPDVTVIIVPEANHLFLADPMGGTADYSQLAMEFAPGFLDTLSEWLVERVRW